MNNHIQQKDLPYLLLEGEEVQSTVSVTSVSLTVKMWNFINLTTYPYCTMWQIVRDRGQTAVQMGKCANITQGSPQIHPGSCLGPSLPMSQAAPSPVPSSCLGRSSPHAVHFNAKVARKGGLPFISEWQGEAMASSQSRAGKTMSVIPQSPPLTGGRRPKEK